VKGKTISKEQEELREAIRQTIDRGTHYHLYEELDTLTDQIMVLLAEKCWLKPTKPLGEYTTLVIAHTLPIKT